MCGRFTMLTFDEVEGVVRALEMRTPFNALPDWPARARPFARPGVAVGVIMPVGALGGERCSNEPLADSAFIGCSLAGKTSPADYSAGAVCAAGSPIGFTHAPLIWGFPVEWSSRPVFNTRIETALGPNPGMWGAPIAQGRCLVATAGFFEPHATETDRSLRTGKPIKRQYRFAMPTSAPLLIAGVQQAGRFSLVTTAPNRWVSPIHDRMPLVLRPNEALTWLFGDRADLAALADRSTLELTAAPENPTTPPDSPDTANPLQPSLF